MGFGVKRRIFFWEMAMDGSIFGDHPFPRAHLRPGVHSEGGPRLFCCPGDEPGAVFKPRNLLNPESRLLAGEWVPAVQSPQCVGLDWIGGFFHNDFAW